MRNNIIKRINMFFAAGIILALLYWINVAYNPAFMIGIGQSSRNKAVEWFLSNADGYDKETGTVDIPEKWRKASLDGQMHIEMIKENGEGEKECVISFLYREDSNGVTRIVYDSEDSVNHLCKTVLVFDYVARIEPNWFVY